MLKREGAVASSGVHKQPNRSALHPTPTPPPHTLTPMAHAPTFQHCSDFEDVSIMPSPLHLAATSDGASQTHSTSFADSECLIARGALSAKTYPAPRHPQLPPAPPQPHASAATPLLSAGSLRPHL